MKYVASTFVRQIINVQNDKKGQNNDPCGAANTMAAQQQRLPKFSQYDTGLRGLSRISRGQIL